MNPSGAFTQPEGKLHSLIDPVTEQPAEAVYQNVEKFEKFRKEVFRVPSKDMDCTTIANAMGRRDLMILMHHPLFPPSSSQILIPFRL